jgi:carboxylesterase
VGENMARRKTGCLIIHGFGGDYSEVSALAEHLNGLGYPISCPQLAGHTGKREDLRRVTYRDWISPAAKEAIALIETYINQFHESNC